MLAEARDDVVDVVDGEHDTPYSQSVDGRVLRLASDRGRIVELREFDLPMSIWSPQQGDFAPDVLEATTWSTQLPSTCVWPSSSMPSSRKNVFAASRSSTTMRTLSIRWIATCASGAWVQASIGGMSERSSAVSVPGGIEHNAPLWRQGLRHARLCRGQPRAERDAARRAQHGPQRRLGHRRAHNLLRIAKLLAFMPARAEPDASTLLTDGAAEEDGSPHEPSFFSDLLAG